ncbi:MAG: septal ring lytic transglycosylase RlpA family protein, partial [Myxococcales bacterium]|nr:septal ring lytic transglycosylase RlpA family protein [Myxococcales bacterium]
MKKSIPMPRMKSIPMPRMKPITITLGTLLALSLGSAAIAGCGRTILHESTPSTLPEGGANPLDAEYATRAPLEVLEGRASYYADSLAGNHTANGEIYDIHAFTAASRELPFGTIVRVVRIVEGEASGPSVTVRVNDRGPFGDSR